MERSAYAQGLYRSGHVVLVLCALLTMCAAFAASAHAESMSVDPFRRSSVESDPFRRATSEADPFRRNCAADTDPFRRNSKRTAPFRRAALESDPFRRAAAETDPFRRNGSKSEDPFRRNDCASGALASEMLVVLVDGADPAAAAARIGVTPIQTYTEGPIAYAAVLSSGQLSAALADSQTQWIEASQSTFRIEPTPLTEVDQSTQTISTAASRIGVPLSPTAAIDGVDNRVDVDVAVLDSGVDIDHPDLNVAGGTNCTNSGGASYDDTDGHGTMVAGFAGALDNSIGRVGVAPGARIWGVKVANGNGLISNRNFLCGLNWVAAHADTIDVVNMSFGGFEAADLAACDQRRTGKHRRRHGAKSAIREALCELNARGVVLVASAGNDAADATGYIPASFPEVIAASALADQDGLAGGLGGAFSCLTGEVDDAWATFSNHGSIVDIGAPGVCVSSTFADGHYAIASGTSFSAPQVAGAAALLKSRQPSASPAEIRQQLLQAASSVGSGNGVHSEGLLNVSSF